MSSDHSISAPAARPNAFLVFIAESVMVKLALVGVISLLLLIPLTCTHVLIEERAGRKEVVEDEVASKWGGAQTLVGPFIVVPVSYPVVERVDDRQFTRTETARVVVAPDSQIVKGQVVVIKRKRAIFEVPLYRARLVYNGHFERRTLDSAVKNVREDATADWSRAEVIFGLSSRISLQDRVALKLNGKRVGAFSSSDALGDGTFRAVGVQTALGPLKGAGPIRYQFQLKTRGARDLRFAPIAEDTRLSLASSWPSPSFQGALLPAQRYVSADGFSASWRLFDFHRSHPQYWYGDNFKGHEIAGSAVGVDFIDPGDDYAKNLRAAKYAILAIVLTFMAFFFFEWLSGVKIHPVQYLLVGAALSVFHLLLLSLSEHIGFDYAFGVALAATLTLIGTYSLHFLKLKRRAALLLSVISIVYGFIFVILRLEDYALLGGSIGVFIALAVVMMLSRRVELEPTKNDEYYVAGVTQGDPFTKRASPASY